LLILPHVMNIPLQTEPPIPEQTEPVRSLFGESDSGIN
jgi:hypothetical protein